LLGKCRIQVQEGFERRKKEKVTAVFNHHKNGQLVSSSSLRAALNDLGIRVTESEIDELLKSSDINNDGGLDFDEFSVLVSRSSPGLDFLRSLPLAELVFDGLPKTEGCAAEDQLRKLCKISQKELDVSVKAIAEGLGKMLQENLTALKKAYDLLDSKAAENDTASAKFQIIKMSVGTIEDFHAGIAARIGDVQTRYYMSQIGVYY
jgi:hypothetical protein